MVSGAEGVSQDQITLEMLTRVTRRGVGKSMCPSEIARTLWPDDWRKHMNDVRDVAYALRDENKISITQRGVAIHVGSIGVGAIRLTLPDAGQ